MKRHSLLLLLTALLSANVSAGVAEEDLDRPSQPPLLQESAPLMRDWQFSVGGTWMYGPADGYVETPSGGEPGSTSDDRPALDELGIDDASLIGMELTASWHNHGLYFKPQWVRLSGDAVLDEEFISQGRNFAAGSSVDSEIQLDWYRFGYRYAMQLGEREVDGSGRWELGLNGGAVLFDFDAQIDGEDGAFVDRSYLKISPQFGVDLEWRATDRLSVRGELFSSLGFSSLPLIFTSQLTGRYELDGWANQDLSAIVGIAYEVVHFEDSQETPNDIEVDFGPMLVLGLELEF